LYIYCVHFMYRNGPTLRMPQDIEQYVEEQKQFSKFTSLTTGDRCYKTDSVDRDAWTTVTKAEIENARRR
jgi:hypothetical protein